MTATLKTPTALDLRAEYQQLIRNDLLGPAGGPEEEIDEASVRGRYILGLIAPKGTPKAKAETYRVPAGARWTSGWKIAAAFAVIGLLGSCLLYTSPSPRDRTRSRMPSSA